jgi:hypothetical protein
MVHRSTVILKRLVYGVSPGLGYFLGSLSLYNLRLRYEHLARCLIAQHGLVVQGVRLSAWPTYHKRWVAP